MGMDVYGKKPKNEAGKYFRNNVWWWRPLADYCLKVGGEVAGKCKAWHSNDGKGLGASDSLKLAKILREEIESGCCEVYEREYNEEISALPRVKCDLCKGTGIRTDSAGVEMGMPTKVVPGDDKDNPRAGQTGWCNGCNGRGDKESWGAHYPFSVKNVKEFIEFLENCGGFEIC